MQDYIEQFEILNEAVGNVFRNIGSKLFGSKTTNSNVPASIQHKQNMDSGAECPIGTSPNRLFTSELGSSVAAFGPKANGIVNNINPLLGSLKISKRDLRCYDFKTDKYKLAWLFKGDFNADKIIYKGKKFYFYGTWGNGAIPNNVILLSSDGTPTMPTPKKTAPPQISFYILIDGKQTGPYNSKGVSTLVQHNVLTPNVLIWKAGLEQWIPAKNDPQINALINSVNVPAVNANVPPVQPRAGATPNP